MRLEVDDEEAKLIADALTYYVKWSPADAAKAGDISTKILKLKWLNNKRREVAQLEREVGQRRIRRRVSA